MMFLRNIIARAAITDEQKLLHKNAESVLETMQARSHKTAMTAKDVLTKVAILTYNDAKFIYAKWNWVNVEDRLEEEDIQKRLLAEPAVQRRP